MRSLLDRVSDFLGRPLIVGSKDYGLVVDSVAIYDSGNLQRVLLICDSGKRVDLASVLRFFASHGNVRYYPDGSDYSKRSNQKKLYRYQVMFPSSIPSDVRIGSQTISITSKEK